jgi:hypothetical protein
MDLIALLALHIFVDLAYVTPSQAFGRYGYIIAQVIALGAGSSAIWRNRQRGPPGGLDDDNVT